VADGLVKTILLTGAAGFVGRRVAPALRRRGWHVITTDQRGDVDHRGDLADEAFTRALPDADAVVHAAAVQYVTPRLPLIHRSAFFERNNVLATHLLGQRYGSAPGLHFVNIGTSMMYRQCGAARYAPDSELQGQGVYSRSKLAAQREVERAFAHWATVVPCIIGGPGREGLFRGFVQSIRRSGRVLYPGRGAHPTAMVHVDDVAELVAVVIERGARGLVNAAAREALSIAQWATHIADELGVPPPRHVRLPLAPVAALAAVSGWRLIAREQLLMLQQPHVLDIDGSLSLGWRPQHDAARIVRDIARHIAVGTASAGDASRA
jgi:nucleoside-diphosphate-sugar epimerase